MVFVPFFEFEVGLTLSFFDFCCAGIAFNIEDCFFAAPGECVSSELVVQPNEPVGLGVVINLVAPAVVGDFSIEYFRAELEATVDTTSTDNSVFQFQLKVPQFPALVHKIVVPTGGLFFGDFCGDSAIFDRPETHVCGLPVFKGFTVEDGGEAFGMN